MIFRSAILLLLVIVISIGALLAYRGCFAKPRKNISTSIDPEEMTQTAITETSVRIGLYYQRNKKLPARLVDLPARTGYINRITDGWDRELSYAIEGNNRFSLTSLGRDGKTGGAGDDADRCERFRVVHGDVETVR
jgi:hypothetical protein